MRLVNDFSVAAPLDTAWAALTDIPTVVGCIPGAEFDGQDGDDYSAHVAVKIGPVGLTLTGTASVVRRDDTSHEMVVRGRARDRKGNGSAAATVTMVAREATASACDVTVVTELELDGRIAQFGAGVISQVSNRILTQFVRRLDASITGGDATPPPAAAPGTAMSLHSRADRIHLVVTAVAGVLLGLAIGRTVHRIG